MRTRSPSLKGAFIVHAARFDGQLGKRAESKKETLAALEIAPSYERAQALLLKLVDAPGRP